LSYVVFIYVIYLCFIFFQVIRHETLQIQGMMHYGFYNPNKLHAFRNVKSVTRQFILDSGVPPKVWTVSGVLMHFWTVLFLEHVLFDCTYDL